MTAPKPWTAPGARRAEPPTTGGEREQLEAWLDYHRQTLLTKCAGLTAGQLATPSVPPSGLTLLGLLRHLADCERFWFRQRFLGDEAAASLYCTDEQPDGDLDNIDEGTAEEDYGTFLREVELSRAAVAQHELDETYLNDYRQARMDLRWIYMHLIEEYARHNGHADLIRERIDGATGD